MFGKKKDNGILVLCFSMEGIYELIQEETDGDRKEDLLDRRMSDLVTGGK